MPCSSIYSSPFGDILMRSEDGKSLSRLIFCNSDEEIPTQHAINSNLPLFTDVKRWLDSYFSGNNPPFTPPLSLQGTDFQKAVWQQVLQIPYGKTASYGEIAISLLEKRNVAASPRAIGGAVARNPVAIIVPCHRVLSANGALTGYKWGIERKQVLLMLENSC